MTATVSEIVEAFHHLYCALRDKEFGKSLRLDEWTERELLPLVRTFLLGWFGHKNVQPECGGVLPGSLSGNGRLDFIVSGVAVELAVRRKGGRRQNLSNSVNSKEAKKLMKYDGLALLVLLDFSKDPLDEERIEGFRFWPSLGKGNHKKSPFNVSYHFKGRNDAAPRYYKKNISVL